MRVHDHHHAWGHHGHHHHAIARHWMRRGGWAREGGEQGGRRRRVFDSGELRLILLKLIADQPRHGYDLIRAIEELSGGVYAPSPGIVYPTLTMLNDMGQIEEATSAGARKAFAITADGAEYLAARKAEVDALLARLAEFATARQRTDRGPIRRAMQNLRAVLINRFERDDVSSETMHQVAAILDEAAQRIEKL
ncbi:MAG TPA: PadR family transcriptional regulator [Reyranella sp.]|nr:PadR family transcriptional regulator [Reyranella sp.]